MPAQKCEASIFAKDIRSGLNRLDWPWFVGPFCLGLSTQLFDWGLSYAIGHNSAKEGVLILLLLTAEQGTMLN